MAVVSNITHQQIEQELTTLLTSLSVDQLKKTTRKKCRGHLEKKFNQSFSKHKSHIKSFLIQYMSQKFNQLQITNNNKHSNDNNNKDKNKNILEKNTEIQNGHIANPRKRKLNETSPKPKSCNSPPAKKIKLEISSKVTVDTKDNDNEEDINDAIMSPNSDDFKQNIKVKSSVALISSLTPIGTPNTNVSASFNIERNIETTLQTTIDNVAEMTSLIETDNLISEINEKLSNRWSGNGTYNNKSPHKYINMEYDDIEYETMKTKFIKAMNEMKEWKQKAKKYAAILFPKEKEIQNIKKQNEILNKNIEILKNKHIEEIKKLENTLKNESENVKEERYKYLRREKYIQRVEKKFDYVCKKYNIDKDVVVAEMT